MCPPLLVAPCRGTLIALCTLVCCSMPAAAAETATTGTDAWPTFVVALGAAEAARWPTESRHYAPPPLRAAAAAGADTLRSYIFRTRMIHNYYYADWEHLLPRDERWEP